MNKIIALIIVYLTYSGANIYAQSKVVFGTFEDNETTNMMLAALHEDYTSVSIGKFNSLDLSLDSSLSGSLPKKYFIAVKDSLRNLDKKQAVDLLNVFRDRKIYYQGRIVKKNLTEQFTCSEVEKYDILISCSNIRGAVLKLILSSNSKRFCFFYQFEREIFILYNSCINDIGWDRINKFLIESRM
jgi:hypothetical protein